MAIIQSILVGKGKGKIGNVVLSGLKGQTVAKQLNSSPLNPRTVAQTSNRVKMANAVLAWQYLASFFSAAKALRKPLESTYNAFIRSVKAGMSSAPSETRVQAAKSALSHEAIAGNWFPISLSDLNQDSLTVTLSASGVAHSESMRVRGILLSETSGEQSIVDRAVALAEFTAGSFSLQLSAIDAPECVGIYIYDSAGSKITNVAFSWIV